MICFVLYKKPYLSHKLLKYKFKSLNKSAFYLYNPVTGSENVGVEKEISIFSQSQNSIQKIKELYIKHKERVFNHLKIDFSIGIWDNKLKTFIGGRDRLGIKPFYYYSDDELFIYSNDLRSIIEILNINTLDEKWIGESLSGIVTSKVNTQYSKINKLEPGYYIKVSTKETKLVKYWSLKIQQENNLSDKENINIFRDKLYNAVISRLSYSNGVELSGGLDSGGVASILQNNITNNIYTYSHVLDEKFQGKIKPFGDERIFRDSFIDLYPNTIFRDIPSSEKGLLNEMRRELNIQGAPITTPLTFFSDELLDAAKNDKINVLFSGFGGDEGVSNYANMLNYEYATKFKFSKLQQSLNSSILTKKFWKHIAYSNLRKYYSSRNIKNTWYYKNLDYLFINEDFETKNQIRNNYLQDFKKLKFNTFNQHLYNKLSENHIQVRLETSLASSMHRGVEYAYPLLDYELIEFYTSVPNHLKLNKSVGRYIYRQALKDILPKIIYKRNDKTGAVVPNVFLRFLNDYEEIIEFLKSVESAKGSEYIDIPKMLLIANEMKLIATSRTRQPFTNQRIFFTALMILLYLNEQ